MLTTAVANLAGIFIFLYLFWKRLKEDYVSGMLFTGAFLILAGLGLGFTAAKIVSPQWWFWFAILGGGLGMSVAILRFRLRIFETVEATTFSLLPWLGLVFMGDSINRSSLPSFIASVFCGVLLALFVFFDRRYKSFSWYISGRIGFSGLLVMGFFFSIRAIVAYFFADVLSFVSVYEPVASGLAAFLFYFLFFRLAKQVS